ncbi:hypothetical protein FDO65_06900 [Nakamurella flava]|uniref:Uncharacterized protein n=1 Tax=Nakamurella flava TaxID=2576308 RepID=A0A4V6CTW1_9ACTN|nr:hypothetical protein [Nakamurella flava]TKV61325.1 hypothetical protein FDO65_06900 [Nakamurella flava]
MPDSNPPGTPDETAGVLFTGSTEFDRSELRQVVEQVTQGSAIRRVEDRYTYVDAGADYSELQFIVDFGVPLLEFAAIQPVVAYLRRKYRRHAEEKLARTAADTTDEQFESVAVKVITERYTLPRDQVSAALTERGSDGTAAIEVAVAAPDSRRFEVHVRVSDDGITEFCTRRITSGGTR